LLEEKAPNAEIVLTRGIGGVFDIIVNGETRYSKAATGRFPSEDEVLATV